MYKKIKEALYDLKDLHIKIDFIEDDFKKFNLVSPFEFSIELDESDELKPKIYFSGCIDEIYEVNIFENKEEILEICTKFDDKDNPVEILSINDINPFEYFLNFEGKTVSTKNTHGTFSYILEDINYLSLDNILYDFDDDNMKTLKIDFDDEDKTTITIPYFFESDIDINEDEMLNNNQLKINKISKSNIIKELKKTKKYKRNLLKTDYFINWDAKYIDKDGNELFKCYADDDNNVNVYYISSFEASNKNEYIQTIKKCVEIFDENSYPIIVLNDLNKGGMVVLAQIFLGVLSPLMPINLFKGRMRMNNLLENSEEIINYIQSNFTNVYTCEKASYEYLKNGEIFVNYSDIRDNLSEVFFLVNSSVQKEIENIRLSMENKRKPTEILVLTDGYSFSAASLYIKYLQKMGGGIVVGFSGNIFNETVFDSSQSPSPIFTEDILRIFNQKEIETLKKYGIEMEFAGIQTFYNLNETNIPLEYEITPVDDKLNFFMNYKNENAHYPTIIGQALELLNAFKDICYKNNKKVLKITEECDGKFGNKYTHGGYLCGDDEYWSKECKPIYCDMGYIFDEINNICIKDICSSIQNEEEDEIEKEENNLEEENVEDENINKEKTEENESEENYDMYEEMDIIEEIEDNENNDENSTDSDDSTDEENLTDTDTDYTTDSVNSSDNDIKDDEIQAYIIVIIIVGGIIIIIVAFLIIHYFRKKNISNDIEIKSDIGNIPLEESLNSK